MQRITEDVKKNVRSVLISNPKGVKIEELQRDYRNLLGHKLDFIYCGFRTMMDFLEAMPDVAKLEFHTKDNSCRVHAVTDPDLYLPSALKKGIRHLPQQSIDVSAASYQRQVWASELQPNMRHQYAVGISKTPGMTREEISDDFNKAGEVAEVSFTTRSVFVRYNNKEEALDALERFNMKYNLWIPTERNNPRQVVKKKDACVKQTQPTSTNDDIVEIYVGNLPRNIEQEDILAMIDRDLVYQIRDLKKEDKRYMFLAVKRTTADQVISRLHQKHLGGQRIWAQVSYNYTKPESKGEPKNREIEENSSQVIQGHVGVLQDLDYERYSSSESLDSCGVDQKPPTMEMPPLEPALPPLEPALPPLEPALPLLEPALPPLEPAMPPLEPAMPPLEPAMPPLEPAMPPLEPAMPPLEPAMPPLEPATHSASVGMPPFRHVSHQHRSSVEQPSLTSGAVSPRYQGHQLAAQTDRSPQNNLRYGTPSPRSALTPSVVHAFQMYHLAHQRSPLPPTLSPRVAHQPPASLPTSTASHSDTLGDYGHHKELSSEELPTQLSLEEEQQCKAKFRPNTPQGVVYIANFPRGTSYSKLRQLFLWLRPMRVSIIRDEGASTLAVMFMRTQEQAEKALAYDGLLFEGHTLSVYKSTHRDVSEDIKEDKGLGETVSLTVKIKNTKESSARRLVREKKGDPDSEKTTRTVVHRNVSSPPTIDRPTADLWVEKAMCQQLYQAVLCCRQGTQLWTPSDLRSDVITIVVTTIVNDINVWGQVVDSATENELNWLMNATPDMQDGTNQMSFLPGSMTCLALFEGEWFRGCVLEVKRDTASVFALDYGNTVKVPVGELRDLPEDYWGVTAQAWPIRIMSPVENVHDLDQMKVRAKVLNKDNEDPLLIVNILEFAVERMEV